MTFSLTEEIIKLQPLTNSQIDQIFNPWEVESSLDFPALHKVGKRIQAAILNQEKIVVVGDYDADGICATTILVDTFKRLNYEVGYFIPNRLLDGYGLSETIVQQVAAKDYDLIITVDNGVSAEAALNLAKELNITVIVTDHHQLIDLEIDYLLHPSLLPKRYQTLSGAGLTLLLARYLLNMTIVKEHFILAMIATIGDMMPVFEENRVIIIKGLEYLNQDGYLPIDILLNKEKPYLETDIAFSVVPKLNTLGRLSDQAEAYHLVNYLLSKNASEINIIAKQIENLNNQRKTLTNQALSLIDDLENWGSFLVLTSSNLHEGIAGIVAGKIAQEQKLPTIVFSKQDVLYKASARGPEGFDLYQYLSQYQTLFESFGGHKQACGFSINQDNFVLLKDEIQTSTNLKFLPIEKNYLALKYSEIDFSLLAELNKLRPFGTDFLEPDFLIENFTYQQVELLNDLHVKFKTTSSLIDVIYFSGKDDYPRLLRGDSFNLIGSLSINKFRGKETINIIVRELIFNV